MEADPGEETMEVSLTMKEFRLDTFKIHNLGHYYGDIARIGMLDNTSAWDVSFQVVFCIHN